MNLRKQISEEEKLSKVLAQSMVNSDIKASNLSEESIKKVIKLTIEILGRNEYLKSCKLSFRTIAIAFLEDLFWKNNNHNRKDYSFDKVRKGVVKKFSHQLSTRNFNDFKSCEEIHPEKPCQFYEILNHSKKEAQSISRQKGHYKTSLKKIDTYNDIYLELNESKKSIKEILEQVKLC